MGDRFRLLAVIANMSWELLESDYFWEVVKLRENEHTPVWWIEAARQYRVSKLIPF